MQQSIEKYRTILLSFYRAHKRMPSYSEMLGLFGFKSKNAVAKLVDKLVDAGLVEKGIRGELVPAALKEEVRILGYVEAGLPSAVEEADLDTVAVDELLLKNKTNVFLLKVKGESMINAGIHDGDMVLVQRSEHARLGDIVIAEIDGEWTMKYLREHRGRRYLEAANPAFADLHPTQSLSIAGKVIGVIRTYH